MTAPRFLTICLNPVLQKTLTLERLERGAVNRLSEHRFDASGKGINVTRVLSQLGEQVVHLTQLGGRLREQFLALAADDNLTVRWCDSGSEIRFCYTLLERQGATTTEVVEEAEPVAPGTEAALDTLFSELLREATWVTFSGSKAAGFAAQLFPRWVAAAKAAGKGVLLDIRGAVCARASPRHPTSSSPTTMSSSPRTSPIAHALLSTRYAP
jgi:fructose-1-phosphate kinase PfkB-like protein